MMLKLVNLVKTCDLWKVYIVLGGLQQYPLGSCIDYRKDGYALLTEKRKMQEKKLYQPKTYECRHDV